MQELEKILEEIGELRGQAGSECTSEDHYIKKAWEHCLDRVVGIIRKHMNACERFEFDFTNVKSFDCQCGRHYVNTGAENNEGWIPVDERLPEPGRIVLITQTYSWENFEEGASVTIGRLSPEKNNKMWEFQYYRPDFRSGTIMDNDIICPGSEYVIAWRPLPEPYHPERSE